MNASDMKGKVDVGILTIREDELEAVLARFSDAMGTVAGRREYNLRRVETIASDTYVVAVVRCAEQGNTEAQDAARDLLEDLDPQWLLVVGIAGGVPASEFSLGDVVVATRIVDFSLEAAHSEGRREYSLGGGPLDRAVTRVVANLPAMTERLAGWNDPDAIGIERPALDPAPEALSRRLYGDKGWRSKVRRSLEENFEAGPRPPKATAGPIAASDRLLKDDRVLGDLLAGARHVLAVEMESAGIYRAAHGRRTPFLAIRGISDIVGHKRSAGWTEYACRTAAAFAYGFLRARPFSPRGSTKKEAPLPAPSLTGIPPRFERIVGREDLIEKLAAEVLKEQTAPVIVLGPAGIGKSTLALAVERRQDVIARFGERRWFIRLDTATTAAAALGQIAGQLRAGDLVEPGVELSALVRAKLGEAPALLILDNLETPWERDLLATEALLSELSAVPGLSLVASVRGTKRPAGIAWGAAIDVPVLDPGAAHEVFFAIAPEHRRAPAADVDRLLAQVGGVPLAITLLAHAAQGADIEMLLQEWGQRRTDLLEREGAAPDRLSSWRASLAVSLQSSRMTPEAARLASLLAALPDGMAQGALAALFPEAGAHAARVLAQLGLIYLSGGRLLQLPPVRAYIAREQPAGEDDLDRAMEWYGDLARSLGPLVGRSGGREAAERLGQEMGNLDAMIRRGLSSGDAGPWIDAALALANYAVHSGHQSPLPLEEAREAAAQAGDAAREAGCILELGCIAKSRSEHARARELFETAFTSYRRSGFVLGEARCLWALGDIALACAEDARAQGYFEAALPICRQAGDRLCEADCLRGLGHLALRYQRYHEATERYEQAAELYRLAGDRLGDAQCVFALGDVALRRRELDVAESRYQQASGVFRELGLPLGEANSVLRFGDIDLGRNNGEKATRRYKQALQLHRNVANPSGQAAAIQGLADVALYLGSDPARAASLYEEALRLYHQIGDILGEAHCITHLGTIAQKNADLTLAERHYRAALDLYARVPYPLLVGYTHLDLARITSDPSVRRQHLRAARAAWSDLDRPDLLAKLDKEFGPDLFRDRVSEIRVEGLRTLQRIRLPLRGLTVLIGENGAGKSSIIEACELLRRASGPQFFSELHGVHGGLFNLLCDGSSELRLAARVEGDEPVLDYEITLVQEGASTIIAAERLRAEPAEGSPESVDLIDRNRDGARIREPGGRKTVTVGPSQSVLGAAGLFSPHPAIARMKAALAGIEVHLPFEVLPLWASRAHGRPSIARASVALEQTERVSCLGDNLANAYHALRNNFSEEHWHTTMEYVRLGLGDDVESIDTRVDEAGAAVALSLKRRNRDRRLPASALADGALAYLSFVALLRLSPAGRTLLAFDEPELHLHPALLVRVVDFLETMADAHPVLVATQSDRLLDALRDPARSVRVCTLSEQERATRLQELDAGALAEWLEEYRGLGDLRGAGYLSTVLKPEEPA